jgi:transcriptional regulator with XRE-family HTH domain
VAPGRTREQLALGQAIRDLRARRHMSQEDLADEAGLHRTYIGGIERGERNVAYMNIRRIAAALDVRPSQLLARAERHESGGR